MRISDWSSDVCSSDLLPCRTYFGCILAYRLSRNAMRPDCRHDGGKRYWPRAHRGAKDTAACGAPCPSGPSESAQYTAEIRNRADALFPPAPSYVKIGRESCRESVCPYV